MSVKCNVTHLTVNTQGRDPPGRTQTDVGVYILKIPDSFGSHYPLTFPTPPVDLGLRPYLSVVVTRDQSTDEVEFPKTYGINNGKECSQNTLNRSFFVCSLL